MFVDKALYIMRRGCFTFVLGPAIVEQLCLGPHASEEILAGLRMIILVSASMNPRVDGYIGPHA